jgi:hypothetical protein
VPRVSSFKLPISARPHSSTWVLPLVGCRSKTPIGGPGGGSAGGSREEGGSRPRGGSRPATVEGRRKRGRKRRRKKKKEKREKGKEKRKKQRNRKIEEK